MFKPLLKISNRTLIVVFETIAVLTILCAFAVTAFVWRVSQGPVSIGFAKEYVEEALSDESQEFSVRFEDMVFSWPELKGPFMLDLQGLRVRKGAEEANALTIDSASVGLSRRALIFGLIRPVSVIINKPSLELVRARDGKMTLFFQGANAQEEKSEASRRMAAEEEVAQIFKDMAARKQRNILSRLRAFEIRHASVAVRDYQLGLSWYVTDLNFAIRNRREGVAASVEIPLPGGKKESAHIEADLAYRKETDDFRALIHIDEVNPYIISRFLPVPDALGGQDLYFTGDIEASLDTNMKPLAVTFMGAIPEGLVNLPQEYDAPIALKDIALSSNYDAATKKLTVSNLSGSIGGIVFDGKGQATIKEDSLSLPITLNVASLQREQIPPLFPKSEHDGEAYEWLARNIEGGSFSDVSLGMVLTAVKVRNEDLNRDEWSVDVPQMKLDFAFEGAKVTYNDTLMPASEASGKGSLDLAAEVLEITEGRAKIGDIQGENVSVKVTDLMTAGAGYVYVKTKMTGPLSTALQYIAAEPIGMDEKRIGLDYAKVKGTIAADVDVSLPTLKDVPKESVDVKVNGTLTDITVPEVVEGLTLSGGPLTVATQPGGFTIKGKAQLAGRDTVLDWHQNFDSAGKEYSMRIAASIGADQQLRNHFGVNLDEYISGTMPVDVVYIDKGNGVSTVDVRGDLNPVRVYIDPFKFEKPVGMPGSVSAKATLKDDVLKELTGLEIKSRDFSVSGASIQFAPMNGKKADLSKGNLPNAVLGKTKAAVTFEVTPANVMMVRANAPIFDFTPFLQEAEASTLAVPKPPEERGRAMKISLNADSMLLKNDQKASAVKAYIEIDPAGDPTQIEYDGRIGRGNLFVRFRPDQTGKRTFRLQTDDAGNVLYAFGLYENIHGGTLIIYGEPKGANLRGNLHGAMRMENFRVVKAPALASLLSLMSLTGVSQILSNQGLVFSKLESGFEWRFRPEGNLLIIKDGKTSGSSVGLTFSGVVDRGKKTTDIAGTIIPMTEVNSLLAKIPLVGEILGGASGLIAATYSMKGPSSDPKVMVNPLSVLAPGIIRRILFEGGYESKIPEDPEAPGYVPPKAEAPKAAIPQQPVRTQPPAKKTAN